MFDTSSLTPVITGSSHSAGPGNGIGNINGDVDINAKINEPRAAESPLTLSRLALEVMVRASTASLLAVFGYSAWLHWRADPSRITLLLIVVAECLTVGLSLVARVPRKRDWHALAMVLSVGGTYYFLAVQLAPGVRLIPEFVGATLQIAGIAWQMFAKLSLRRSFGILPANRGVVSRGAYRFIRHPMYLGYLLSDLGFLLSNFGVQNLLVYGIQFSLQAGRIVKEEGLLSEDPQYVRYKASVRYRVIPGVF